MNEEDARNYIRVIQEWKNIQMQIISYRANTYHELIDHFFRELRYLLIELGFLKEKEEGK